MNRFARYDHVSNIEHHIQTLKDQCHCNYKILILKKSCPMHLFIELYYDINFWLHIFLSIGEISSTLSPCEIITGVKLGNDKHCVITFGAYFQTHGEHDNSFSTCNIGSIALHLTDNKQGSHYFLSQ